MPDRLSTGSLQEDVELPLHLLDLIYDDLVRIRLGAHLPQALAQWIGADTVRLMLEGAQAGLVGDAILPLRSLHDGIHRGHLLVSWPADRRDDADRAQGLRAVCNHVATALAYREKLLDSRCKYEVFADGLDRLSVGAIIVQENGQPVDANRAARKVLDRRDGLSVIGGKICAAMPADQKAMRQLMDAVLSGEVAQGGMQLQRPSGEPDLYLLVLRRPSRQGMISAGVRMLLRDPASAAVHSRAALTDLYGLTEAEAGITIELANGNTPEDVEDRLCIRHNTMRAHLRAIYAKVGVGSHAELVFTILTGAGTLAIADDSDFEPLEPLTAILGEQRDGEHMSGSSRL